MSKEAKNIFNSYEVNCLIWKIRCNVEVLVLWRKWSFIPCRFNRILLSQRNRVWEKISPHGVTFSISLNIMNIDLRWKTNTTNRGRMSTLRDLIKIQHLRTSLENTCSSNIDKQLLLPTHANECLLK